MLRKILSKIKHWIDDGSVAQVGYPISVNILDFEEIKKVACQSSYKDEEKRMRDLLD